GNLAFGPDFDSAQEFMNDVRGDNQLLRLAFGDASCLLAANGSDVAFQVTDTGFARVVTNDVPNAFFGKLDLLDRNAVLFDLSRDEVLEGNMHLLFLGVSLQLDDLHAVPQRFRHRIQHV